MNPLLWSREHQVAAIVMAIVCALIGLIVGYHVNAVRAGAGGYPHISWWLQRFLGEAALWALIGAAIGFALVYVRQLLSK
jgi:hypothetical protein